MQLSQDPEEAQKELVTTEWLYYVRDSDCTYLTIGFYQIEQLISRWNADEIMLADDWLSKQKPLFHRCFRATLKHQNRQESQYECTLFAKLIQIFSKYLQLLKGIFGQKEEKYVESHNNRKSSFTTVSSAPPPPPPQI